MTEEDDFLAFLNIEIDMVEEHRSVLIDGFQVLYLKNLVARLALHLEDDAGILAAGGLDLLDVELLKHLLAARRLTALGHIGRETADELLQLFLLLLSLHLLVLCLTEGKLRALIPEAVVAGEDGDFAEVDIDGLRRYGIEEVTVVAHHEHGLVLINLAEIVLQPLHGIEVEVVGRLIEEQVVGLAEERLGQHDTHLLIVGKLRHLLLVQIFRHAEVLQQLCGIALGLPAVHLCKLLLELRGAVAVFLCHLRL